MGTKTIYVDAATGYIINSVNGGRVSPNDLPDFFENGNSILIIRVRTVTNPGTSEAVLTAFTLGTGAAYQLSLTEGSDWVESTPPLIRVNNPSNIYVSDAANSEITAEWKNTTQEFRDYIESDASGGIAAGGIEMIELSADPTPIAETIQDAAGINAGDKQLTVSDASDVELGDRCLINDANAEVVIISGIDTGTNILTFVGNGNDGGTVYSHANGAALVISTSEEKVLTQDDCILRDRRDLGGQAPTEIDPAYMTAAETLAALNLKVNKDLSAYTLQSTVDGTEVMYLDNGERVLLSTVKNYIDGATKDLDLPSATASVFDIGTVTGNRGYDITARLSDETANTGGGFSAIVYYNGSSPEIQNIQGFSNIANFDISDLMVSIVTGKLNLTVSTTAGNALKMNLKAIAI